MYVFIALLHAVPVFVVAAVIGSRIATLVTAGVMVAIGVMTGSPAYTAIDVLAVAAATWISLVNSPASKSSESRLGAVVKATVREVGSAVIMFAVVLGVLLVGIVFYNRTYGECSDSVLQQRGVSFKECREQVRQKK